MTEHREEVEKRKFQLEYEGDMNRVTAVIRRVNQPLGEDYTDIYHRNGKVIRKFADKRKKDLVITEAHLT
jgi:hypothetical protein